MGDLSPSLRPAGVYTHLYTTFNRIRLKPNQIKRSISMCQALGQCSFRAITKLIYYLYDENLFYITNKILKNLYKFFI